MKVDEIIWDVKAKARRQSRPRLTLADLNRLRQLRQLRQEEQQTKCVRLKRIYDSHEDASAAAKPTKIAKKTPTPKPNQPNKADTGDQDAAQQETQTGDDVPQDGAGSEQPTKTPNAPDPPDALDG